MAAVHEHSDVVDVLSRVHRRLLVSMVKGSQRDGAQTAGVTYSGMRARLDENKRERKRDLKATRDRIRNEMYTFMYVMLCGWVCLCVLYGSAIR